MNDTHVAICVLGRDGGMVILVMSVEDAALPVCRAVVYMCNVLIVQRESASTR